MKRGVFDVLRRAVDNTIANWPLVLIRIAVLTVGVFLLWVFVFDRARGLPRSTLFMAPMFQMTPRWASRSVVATSNIRPLACSAAISASMASSILFSTSCRSGRPLNTPEPTKARSPRLFSRPEASPLV